MKRIMTLLVATLVLSFQKNNPKTTLLLNDNLEILKGNVKQITEIEHNHTAESEYPLSFITNTTFDKLGNVVSQRKLQVWEKKWRQIRYTYGYDVRGKKTKVVVIYPKEWGSNSYSIWTYKYDKDGTIIESTIHLGKGKSKATENYKYDTDGNMIESNPSSSDYFYKMEYKYDNKQYLIQEVERPDEGNSVSYFDQYKSFDSNGNWKEKIRIKSFKPLPNTKDRFTDTITRQITYY